MENPNRYAKAYGILVLRGDERLQESRISVRGKFCVVHGSAAGVVRVLAEGERYLACQWCIGNSPHIFVENAEREPV